MTKPMIVAIAVGLLAAAWFPSAANAEHTALQSKDKVEGACNENGGVYFPPSSTSSTYGCLNKDGSGIVCGGGHAGDKNSCDTWPASLRLLPTRAQVRAAASAKVH